MPTGNTVDQFTLPSLADLPRDATALSGYILTGTEFSVDMPVNLVEADETAAVFSPTGESAFSEMACAGYFFSDVEGTGSQFLQMEWNQAPEIDWVSPKLYLGLANWDELAWDWFAQTDVTTLSLDAIDPYIEADTGRLFVIVIVRGTDQANLAEIGFPGLEAPDYGPRVEYLTRIAGRPDEEVRIGASVYSLNPAEYSWDFGGGADPNTTTNTYPEVTLGAVGVYDCNLTVTSEDGTDSYDFKLHVTDDLYLVGGKTGFDYEMGEDTYIELLLTSEYGALMQESDQDGMFLFKNIPDGEYAITPIKYENWNPVSQDVTINGSSVTDLRFYRGVSSNEHVIQGSIFKTSAGSLSCEVNLTGDETRTCLTGVLFPDLSDGSYRVTPNDPAYNFWPEYRDIVLNRASAHDQNFVCSMGPISKYTLSGTVTVNGQPASGITIKSKHLWLEYAVTDASGYYEFTDVPAGPSDADLFPHLPEEEFTVVPSLGHIVNIDSDKTGLDFTITVEE